MKNLKKIDVVNFTLENGSTKPYLPLSYQLFGQPLGEAPVVVVNHALTGNSNVSGENGWSNDLMGEGKTINTNSFTIIAFNIPGNGFDNNFGNLISDYKQFTIRDIANIFWEGLFSLDISEVFVVIGGCLGGAIVWELAVL